MPSTSLQRKHHRSSLTTCAVVVLATLLVFASPTLAASRAATEPDRYAESNLATFHFKRLYCANVATYMWFYTVQPAGIFAETGVPFDFQEDASTVGGYCVMAGFDANDGTSYTRDQGFDPCEYTNCLGVSCRNGTEFLVQEYEDPMLYLFGSTDQNYRYLDYGEIPPNAFPRCGCWDPNMVATIANQNPEAYIVDPTGPSTQQTEEVCSHLACSEDPSVDIMYYVHSADGEAENCQCCQKDLHRLYILDETERVCGALSPIPAPSTTTQTPGSGGSGSGSGGGSPNPVEPPADISGFMEAVCPAGTLDDIPQADIEANADNFCCFFTSRYETSSMSYSCGAELLVVRGIGTLNCVSSMPNHSFTCCGSLALNGGVTTTGRVCDDAIGSGSDSALRGTSTLLAAVVAFVLAYVAFSAAAF